MIVTGDAVLEWIAKQTHEYGRFGGGTAIGIERGGKLVGGVAYCDWNGVNVVCHVASDGSKMWMTKEYLRIIFDYPFEQLKCKRITVSVGEGNSDSRKFVRKLGFELEARLSSAHPTGDLLIFAMFKQNCRWIHL